MLLKIIKLTRGLEGSGIELAVENHHLFPSQFVATALAVISDD